MHINHCDISNRIRTRRCSHAGATLSMLPSKERALPRRRLPEPARVQAMALVRVQAEPLAGDVEPISQQVGEGPLAFHATAELRIVFTPAAHVPDARHDVRG